MFKNYFTVALRNFRRNKTFSLINISGLAIGISAALVIYMIVHFEFSFERSIPDRDRIYRVVTNMHFPDQDFKNTGVPGPLVGAMRNEIPGIERSSFFWIGGAMKVTVPLKDERENIFRKQDKIIFADEEYFRFFNYQWLSGSPDKALDGPGKIVLTESRARAYFPYSDISNAIGQQITYNDTVKVTVSGIVKDPAETTDLIFREFISLSTFSDALKKNNGWGEWGSVSSASQFFVKLKSGTDTGK